MLGQLSTISEFEQNEHMDLITDEEDLDIYNVITQWYTNQLKLIKTSTKGCLSTDNWNNCFKKNYFTVNIFNKINKYVTPNLNSSNTSTNTHTFGSTKSKQLSFTGDSSMSLNTQLERLRDIISVNDESSNFSSVNFVESVGN